MFGISCTFGKAALGGALLSSRFLPISSVFSVFYDGSVGGLGLWHRLSAVAAAQQISLDILCNSGRIPQRLNDLLLVFLARIVKVVIVILQRLVPLSGSDALEQTLQLVHEIHSVHIFYTSILPSNSPVTLSAYLRHSLSYKCSCAHPLLVIL